MARRYREPLLFSGKVRKIVQGPDGGAALSPGLAPDLAGLEPIESIRSRWPALIAGLLTAAMIAGLAHELLRTGLAGLSRAVPHNPLFYVAFAATYLSLPVGDFIIFRRLWGIPLSGIRALMRKRIANEVVFGYSGEAYFYAWARQNVTMVAAPFGAVKDASILSAVAGNVITLVMIGLALPFSHGLLTPAQTHTLAISAGIVFLICLPFFIFPKRVFSLPRQQLWWVFGVQCARLVAGSVFIALAWHFGLPQVSVGMWLVLAAARLLVSRLPFVPNKDLLFANLAIVLIGRDVALGELVAFTAALTLVVHVVLIAGFGVETLMRKEA